MPFRQFGNAKIDVNDSNIDLLSLSAHKFYGPKGIGCLYVRDGIIFEKFVHGGHQEKNMRAGTENVAGIVGLGSAIKHVYQQLDVHIGRMLILRNYFLKNITTIFPNVKINGSLTNRLPGNCNISFKNIDGNKILLLLDEMGICVSTGSACSSNNNSPSHVLRAIGTPEEYLHGSLRVTIGKYNTKKDVDYLISCLRKIM